MANTITVRTFDDQYRTIEVMKIINCLKNGWSWLDIVVEFDTTIESVKEAIEKSEYVSDENKRMVKNYDRILNKTPKSQKLRAIIKKGETEKLPPYAQEFLGRLLDTLPNFPVESKVPSASQEEISPVQETITQVVELETTSLESEKESVATRNPSEGQVPNEKAENMIVDEVPVKEQESSESAISSAEEEMVSTSESQPSIFEELQRRKDEVKDLRHQITEIVSNNLVEQEILTDIEEKHEKLRGNVAELFDQLKKIQGELLELANQKIEAQTRIKQNEKSISTLEAHAKHKEEEIESLRMVKVFLNSDGTYPDTFKKMLPTEEDIDRLQLEYMKRKEFRTFAAMHIEYMAKIMALVKVLDVFEFNCEVEFNEDIPVPVRTAIHQLLSERKG